MFEREFWNDRAAGASPEQADLAGFGVEAIDGAIGKVDAATEETDQSLLVVDTGPWIFGKRVMLPAGVVDRIDYSARKVFVHRTKDEIKHSPEYDDSMPADLSYRARVQAYYRRGGAGYQEQNRAMTRR